MPNPLFNQLGGGRNPIQMLTQLKSNPLGALRMAGYNVPDNISNPQQIVQYLVNSNQVNQQQLDYAQRMAQMFGGIK